MSAPRPAASPDVPDELAVVLVHLGDRVVALDAVAARGVARADNLTPVRGPVGALRGLVAVHGKVAAVVDPRIALGIEPLGADVAHQQLLVVSGESGRFALLVDDLDVASLPTSRRTTGSGGSTTVAKRGDDGFPLVELADLVAPVLAAAHPALAPEARS